MNSISKEPKLIKITQQLSNAIIINGELCIANTTEAYTVINPATLKEIGKLAICTLEEVNAATNAAKVAQPKWAKLPVNIRGSLVREAAQRINNQVQLLSELISFETGKALKTESLVEANLVADIFNYYAGLALEIKGETIPYDPNILTLTLREPIGVIGAILPWNVPLMLMATKVAPALVAGNTVVLKPSPEASFCVLKAVELMNQILPPGVLNVITGAGDTGKELVNHPEIKKITFTGSVDTGRAVYQASANKIIPVTLELGGKSPIIVCDDADIDNTAQRIIEGMRFTRQGQSCTAASRILVHKKLYKKIVDAVLEKLNKLNIGDPLDQATDIGTIISQRQFDKINYFLNIAEQDPNLTLYYACNLPKEEYLKNGLYLRPCLITGIKNTHELCQKEIFGPVTTLIEWENFDEAIQMANNTEFGLAAGIFTQDITRALQAAHRLEAGFVQINQYQVFRPSMPFGGFKHSGIGKEASARAMIDNFTKEKTVLINMNNATDT
jgi:acyl-CoA reductase-like NAD-dependent aldehyde dehydrogenase